MTEDRRIEPPPHLLKQWVQAAREAAKKGGPYAKTFAMAAIDWALNSQPAPNDHQIGSLEITPPPELYKQWEGMPRSLAFEAAYRAGANEELEACCEWVSQWRCMVGGNRPEVGLRASRRPKPPSLKKLAYDALDTYIYGEPNPKDKERTYNTIRRALEQLDD